MLTGLLWIFALTTTVLWSYGVLTAVGLLLGLSEFVQGFASSITADTGLAETKVDVARWAEAIAITLLILAWPAVCLVTLSAPHQPVYAMSWRARLYERMHALSSRRRW
uniref:Uncharacterized protein n=1 Tax=uncultured bacterium esnapd21 TaxID=1366603 RepID=S5TN84_9BACT|nr:hypothetical protein [uncultured bacterium esnapd21]